MRAWTSNWLLLPVVVLTALAYAEMRFQVGQGSGYQTAAPSGTSVEPMPVPLFALLERESFSETLARPLFMPNRRPAEPAAPDADDDDQYTSRLLAAKRRARGQGPDGGQGPGGTDG